MNIKQIEAQIMIIEDLERHEQMLLQEVQSLRNVKEENVRLRAAIEIAPHDKACGAIDTNDLIVCSCWKRKALEKP